MDDHSISPYRDATEGIPTVAAELTPLRSINSAATDSGQAPVARSTHVSLRRAKGTLHNRGYDKIQKKFARGASFCELRISPNPLAIIILNLTIME